MKTLIAEVILIPVLLLAGYLFLVSSSLSSVQSEGQSVINTYGESTITLSVVILSIAQIILLPARWGSRMFKRWIIVISASFAVTIGYTLFVDVFMAVIFMLLYLVIFVSWRVGFIPSKK